MIIGICGKSGSGKTYLSEKLSDKNTIIINVDKIGHMSLKDKTIKKELIKEFGTSILSNDEIDRKVLSKIVFSNKDKMKILEDKTWNFMKEKIEEIINNNKDKRIIIDWALLPKTDLFSKCNLKILINASYKIRLNRISKRDNITIDDFKLRELASINYKKEDFDIISDGKDINNILDKIKEIE